MSLDPEPPRTREIAERLLIARMGWGKIVNAPDFGLLQALILEATRRCPKGATYPAILHALQKIQEELDTPTPWLTIPVKQVVVVKKAAPLFQLRLVKQTQLNSSKLSLLYLTEYAREAFAQPLKISKFFRIYDGPQFERSNASED